MQSLKMRKRRKPDAAKAATEEVPTKVPRRKKGAGDSKESSESTGNSIEEKTSKRKCGEFQFMDFPDEVLLRICQNLNYDELSLTISPVCKRLQRLCKDPTLYRSLVVPPHWSDKRVEFVISKPLVRTNLKHLRIGGNRIINDRYGGVRMSRVYMMYKYLARKKIKLEALTHLTLQEVDWELYMLLPKVSPNVEVLEALNIERLAWDQENEIHELANCMPNMRLKCTLSVEDYDVFRDMLEPFDNGKWNDITLKVGCMKIQGEECHNVVLPCSIITPEARDDFEKFDELKSSLGVYVQQVNIPRSFTKDMSMFPNVKRLVLNSFVSANKEGLLLDAFKCLESLRIEMGHPEQCNVIDTIKSCTDLKSLAFSCRKLDEKLLHALPSSIETLTLVGCTLDLSTNLEECMSAYLPNLKQLVIGEMKKVDGLDRLLFGPSGDIMLKTLEVENADENGKFQKNMLSRCKCLTDLHLSVYKPSFTLTPDLIDGCTVRRLCVYMLRGVPDARYQNNVIDFLSAFPNLQTLVLSMKNKQSFNELVRHTRFRKWVQTLPYLHTAKFPALDLSPQAVLSELKPGLCHLNEDCTVVHFPSRGQRLSLANMRPKGKVGGRPILCYENGLAPCTCLSPCYRIDDFGFLSEAYNRCSHYFHELTSEIYI